MKFKSGRFSLRRIKDAMGDSGGMLISVDPETANLYGENGEIHAGYRIMCGSVYARSYQNQDWWMCTEIVEIKEVVEEGDERAALVKTASGQLYLVGDSEIVTRELIKRQKEMCL